MGIEIHTILSLNPNEEILGDNNKSISDSIVVVIDVLRASTTICAALFKGAKEVIPCLTIEDAMKKYLNFSEKTAILGGERNCIKPIGFNLGNSSTEYSKEIVENKTVIITTSNGTQALLKVKSAKKILIGCFANFSSIEKFLLNLNPELNEIVFLCAGNNGKPALEDSLCAGAFVYSLVNRYDNCYLNEDSMSSLDTFLNVKDRLLKECYNSEHGRKLIELGFKNDIDTALQFDIFPVVPVFKGGRIVKCNLL